MLQRSYFSEFKKLNKRVRNNNELRVAKVVKTKLKNTVALCGCYEIRIHLGRYVLLLIPQLVQG